VRTFALLTPEFIEMSGDRSCYVGIEVVTSVRAEAEKSLTAAWARLGLLPEEPVARRSWYVNVWGTLIRAYSENEGVSPHLGDFHTAQLADNVAAVMLRLPRLQGSILKSAGLDAKNLELLTRGSISTRFPTILNI
jgi:hypothetical protein